MVRYVFLITSLSAIGCSTTVQSSPSTMGSKSLSALAARVTNAVVQLDAVSLSKCCYVPDNIRELMECKHRVVILYYRLSEVYGAKYGVKFVIGNTSLVFMDDSLLKTICGEIEKGVLIGDDYGEFIAIKHRDRVLKQYVHKDVNGQYLLLHSLACGRDYAAMDKESADYNISLYALRGQERIFKSALEMMQNNCSQEQVDRLVQQVLLR